MSGEVENCYLPKMELIEELESIKDKPVTSDPILEEEAVQGALRTMVFYSANPRLRESYIFNSRTTSPTGFRRPSIPNVLVTRRPSIPTSDADAEGGNTSNGYGDDSASGCREVRQGTTSRLPPGGGGGGTGAPDSSSDTDVGHVVRNRQRGHNHRHHPPHHQQVHNAKAGAGDKGAVVGDSSDTDTGVPKPSVSMQYSRTRRLSTPNVYTPSKPPVPGGGAVSDGDVGRRRRRRNKHKPEISNYSSSESEVSRSVRPRRPPSHNHNTSKSTNQGTASAAARRADSLRLDPGHKTLLLQYTSQPSPPTVISPKTPESPEIDAVDPDIAMLRAQLIQYTDSTGLPPFGGDGQVRRRGISGQSGNYSDTGRYMRPHMAGNAAQSAPRQGYISDTGRYMRPRSRTPVFGPADGQHQHQPGSYRRSLTPDQYGRRRLEDPLTSEAPLVWTRRSRSNTPVQAIEVKDLPRSYQGQHPTQGAQQYTNTGYRAQSQSPAADPSSRIVNSRARSNTPQNRRIPDMEFTRTDSDMSDSGAQKKISRSTTPVNVPRETDQSAHRQNHSDSDLSDGTGGRRRRRRSRTPKHQLSRTIVNSAHKDAAAMADNTQNTSDVTDSDTSRKKKQFSRTILNSSHKGEGKGSDVSDSEGRIRRTSEPSSEVLGFAVTTSIVPAGAEDAMVQSSKPDVGIAPPTKGGATDQHIGGATLTPTGGATAAATPEAEPIEDWKGRTMEFVSSSFKKDEPPSSSSKSWSGNSMEFTGRAGNVAGAMETQPPTTTTRRGRRRRSMPHTQVLAQQGKTKESLSDTDTFKTPTSPSYDQAEIEQRYNDIVSQVQGKVKAGNTDTLGMTRMNRSQSYSNVVAPTLPPLPTRRRRRPSEPGVAGAATTRPGNYEAAKAGRSETVVYLKQNVNIDKKNHHPSGGTDEMVYTTPRIKQQSGNHGGNSSVVEASPQGERLQENNTNINQRFHHPNVPSPRQPTTVTETSRRDVNSNKKCMEIGAGMGGTATVRDKSHDGDRDSSRLGQHGHHQGGGHLPLGDKDVGRGMPQLPPGKHAQQNTPSIHPVNEQAGLSTPQRWVDMLDDCQDQCLDNKDIKSTGLWCDMIEDDALEMNTNRIIHPGLASKNTDSIRVESITGDTNNYQQTSMQARHLQDRYVQPKKSSEEIKLQSKDLSEYVIGYREPDQVLACDIKQRPKIPQTLSFKDIETYDNVPAERPTFLAHPQTTSSNDIETYDNVPAGRPTCLDPTKGEIVVVTGRPPPLASIGEDLLSVEEQKESGKKSPSVKDKARLWAEMSTSPTTAVGKPKLWSDIYENSGDESQKHLAEHEGDGFEVVVERVEGSVVGPTVLPMVKHAESDAKGESDSHRIWSDRIQGTAQKKFETSEKLNAQPGCSSVKPKLWSEIVGGGGESGRNPLKSSAQNQSQSSWLHQKVRRGSGPSQYPSQNQTGPETTYENHNTSGTLESGAQSVISPESWDGPESRTLPHTHVSELENRRKQDENVRDGQLKWADVKLEYTSQSSVESQAENMSDNIQRSTLFVSIHAGPSLTPARTRVSPSTPEASSSPYFWPRDNNNKSSENVKPSEKSKENNNMKTVPSVPSRDSNDKSIISSPHIEDRDRSSDSFSPDIQDAHVRSTLSTSQNDGKQKLVDYPSGVRTHSVINLKQQAVEPHVPGTESSKYLKHIDSSHGPRSHSSVDLKQEPIDSPCTSGTSSSNLNLKPIDSLHSSHSGAYQDYVPGSIDNNTQRQFDNRDFITGTAAGRDVDPEHFAGRDSGPECIKEQGSIDNKDFITGTDAGRYLDPDRPERRACDSLTDEDVVVCDFSAKEKRDVRKSRKQRLKDMDEKGRSKEGSDLDAFKDTTTTTTTNTTAQSTNVKAPAAPSPTPVETTTTTATTIAPKTVTPPVEATPPPAVATPPPAVATPPPAVATPPPAVATPPPAVATPPPAVATPPPAAVATPPPRETTPPVVAAAAAAPPKVEPQPAVPVTPAAVPAVRTVVQPPTPEVNNINAANSKTDRQMAPPAEAKVSPQEPPKVEVRIEDRKVAEKNERNDVKRKETSSSSSSASEEKKEEVVEKEAPVIRDNKIELKYKYREGVWEPPNPEAKLSYDRDFLLRLQFDQVSLQKPDNLPRLPDIILDKPYSHSSKSNDKGGGQFIMPGSAVDFTPSFFKPTSMRPGPGGQGSMGRRSQQGGRNKTPMKVITGVSIGKDAIEQLHHAEKAWKPIKKSEKTEDPSESKTQELYRKVKSILNKLTPQKFQKLRDQMLELPIDTEERLSGVIDIIFEKALDEPNFGVTYASMCKCLTVLKVPGSKQGETAVFRKLIITRCQWEFEHGSASEVEVEQKQKAIELAESEEKKKQMKEELEIFESKAKRRSIGNVRFIGELFKLKMMNERIMHICVGKLLESTDEDKLECLCRLLTTIGKDIDQDTSKSRVDQYFGRMDEVVNNKKTSSRVKFMLQDIIDLRRRRWIPRREDNNPKTIDQIHREVAKEEQEKQNLIQQITLNPQQPKPRRGRGPGSMPQQQSEDGWTSVGSKQQRMTIDPTKMKLSKTSIDDNIQLGPGGRPGQMGWGRGSSGFAKQPSENDRPPTPGSRFAALGADRESYDPRGRGAGGRGGASLSRGGSRERTPQQTPQRGKNMRPPSREQERDAAIAAVRNMSSGRPPSRNQSRENSRTREQERREPERREREQEKPPAAPPAPPSAKELSFDEMEKKTKSILDEYLHIQDHKEAMLCVQELQSPNMHNVFVSTALNHVLERSVVARKLTGTLLHDVVKIKYISQEQYLKGLKDVLEFAEDMEIDIPKVWQYLGELISPMVQDGCCLPLSFLREGCQPLESCGKGGTLVSAILHDASQRLGHSKVAELWKSSGLQWKDFLKAGDNVQDFVAKNKLEFTVSNEPRSPTSSVSMEKVAEQLEEFLIRKNVNNEEVFDWIEDNVGEPKTKDAKFIRALMTGICSSALEGSDLQLKVDTTKIKKRAVLLMKYLDHQAGLEIQALYALQALVNKLEHPPGLLRQFFDTLYDEDIISEDAFNSWEQSSDPNEQEGKGVARKSVVQFFTWLREAEEEEGDS